MAIVKPYITKSDLETFLGITISGTDADLAINGAVTSVDNLTGRNFLADTTATARVYDGNNSRELLIDDCVQITLVERGLDNYGDFFETVPSTGLTRYYTRPANELPITSIVLRDNYWFNGLQNQRITAKWGYSVEVPADIANATLILAAGMYMYNKGTASGSVASEKIGNYAVSYPSDAEWRAFKNSLKVLERYRRYYL